jgi:hypothetical protein
MTGYIYYNIKICFIKEEYRALRDKYNGGGSILPVIPIAIFPSMTP